MNSTDAHEVDPVVRTIGVTKPSYTCEGQTNLHGLNVNDPKPKLVVAHKKGDEPKRGHGVRTLVDFFSCMLLQISYYRPPWFRKEWTMIFCIFPLLQKSLKS